MTTRQDVDTRRPASRARFVALVAGVFALALMCLAASHSPLAGTTSAAPAHGVAAESAVHDLHQTPPVCDNCAEHPEGVWAACIVVIAVALAANVGAPRVPGSARRIRLHATTTRIALPVLTRAPNLHALSVSRT